MSDAHPFDSVDPFLDILKTKQPTPGGGAVAALLGALGAALTRMVADLTAGKKKFAEVDAEFRQCLDDTDDRIARFKDLMKADARVFDALMGAFRLPKETDEEKASRKAAIRAATIEAAEVPLQMIRDARDLLPLTRLAAEKGNPHAVSDAGIAAQLISACARAAALNVRINLGSLDGSDAERIGGELESVLGATVEQADAIEVLVIEKL